MAPRHVTVESEDQPVASQDVDPSLFFCVKDERLNPLPIMDTETPPNINKLDGIAPLRIGLLNVKTFDKEHDLKPAETARFRPYF